MLQTQKTGGNDFTLLIYFWGMPGDENPFQHGANGTYDNNYTNAVLRPNGDRIGVIDNVLVDTDVLPHSETTCAKPLYEQWKQGYEDCTLIDDLPSPPP